MKVLIISHGMYPLNSPRANRTTELIKEFRRQGDSVDVIVNDFEKEHESFKEKLGINISYLNANLKSSSKLPYVIQRILTYIFNYPQINIGINLYKYLYKNYNSLKKNNYDLMISIAVPHPIHWGISFFVKKNKKIASHWIADCGDPFWGAVDAWKWYAPYFSLIENYTYSKVNTISIPHENAIKAYPKMFHEKIRIVPQGFDIKLDTDIIEQIQQYKPDNVIRFAYAGLLIKGIRDPRNLISWLLENDFVFEFVIFTKDDSLIKDFIDGEKIKVVNHIPRSDLMSRLTKFDFLLNFENKGSVQVPSKLIDYALINKPILSINTSNIDYEKFKRFIQRNQSKEDCLNNEINLNAHNIVRIVSDLKKIACNK